MTARGLTVHRSRERTPGDRGLAFGRAHERAVANTAAVYLRMFSEDMGLDAADVAVLGERVAERAAAFRPDLVDEIAGIAAGAGQPDALVAALNARTELLAGGRVAGAGGECSVAGIADGDGRCVLAQNWDFHPDLAASRLLWSVELADGFWFATFTEAGLLAKTGLNAAGVGVTLNFLASDADGGIDGLPVHLLLRTLLDSCRDPDAAARLIDEAKPSASACVTVGGPRGAGACGLTSYELSPRGVQAIHANERGLLAHTNHFVAPTAVQDLVVGGTGAASSFSRLEQLSAALPGLEGDRVGGLAGLLSTQDQSGEPIFRSVPTDGPWLDRCATLATVVYDLAARRLWIRVEDDPGAALAEVRVP